jgi:predicted PurR-regulated permease PerM
MGAARTGLVTVITAVVGFYLTRDAPKIVAWLIGLAPPDYRADFRALLTEIYKVWSSFFRGQLILCLIVGVILGTVSAVLGLPQPILLGIWGGLLEFLPSIGNMIWGVTAILLAIFSGSTTLALPPVAFVLLVLGVYVVFTQLDINVLIPNIIGGSIRLHPIVVLLGVIVGIEIGGVLGVALAAPTIASFRVIARYIYAMLFDLEPFPDAPRAKMASPSGDGGQE